MEGFQLEVTITQDEAVVLFEFLARFEHDEKLKIEHTSEEAVLSKIFGQLEKALSEPFSEEWGEILKKSRDTVERKWTGNS